MGFNIWIMTEAEVTCTVTSLNYLTLSVVLTSVLNTSNFVIITLISRQVYLRKCNCVTYLPLYR